MNLVNHVHIGSICRIILVNCFICFFQAVSKRNWVIFPWISRNRNHLKGVKSLRKSKFLGRPTDESLPSYYLGAPLWPMNRIIMSIRFSYGEVVACHQFHRLCKSEMNHQNPHPAGLGLIWKTRVSMQESLHEETSLSNVQWMTMVLIKIKSMNFELVGGFHPSEKYARQIGSFPQVGLKIKNL